MNPFLLLVLSVASEAAGDVCMKLSNGFERKLPVIVGTVATAVIGYVDWGEPITGLMFLGIVLITAGVYLLNMVPRSWRLPTAPTYRMRTCPCKRE